MSRAPNLDPPHPIVAFLTMAADTFNASYPPPLFLRGVDLEVTLSGTLRPTVVSAIKAAVGAFVRDYKSYRAQVLEFTKLRKQLADDQPPRALVPQVSVSLPKGCASIQGDINTACHTCGMAILQAIVSSREAGITVIKNRTSPERRLD